MLSKDRIIYLLDVYTSRKATGLEEQEFMEWMQDAQEDSELKSYVENVWNEYKDRKEFTKVNWDEMFDRVIESETANVVQMEPQITSGRPHSKKIIWYRIAVAAILLLVAGSLWFVIDNKKTAKDHQETIAQTHDVPAPKDARAVITLADGTKVYLDSVNNGTIAQQDNVNVVKNEKGEILYSPNQPITKSPITYNTLTNPRGSRVINMQLSDGSRVWLNAGSSMTYPVAFVRNERKVEITGEAYFEVSHDVSKPFVVSKGETSVTVLGTHFNVNAYDDEEALRVTLLQGSVKVSPIQDAVIIKPNEQAVVKSGSPLTINQSPNIEAVMAWKNGLFQFDRADINMVMKQIARWYDLEVEFNGNVAQHFGGSISRNENASKVFEMLEMTGGVKFKIEGKKVTVNP
jgi:ferric-dicitrate binding protein FerR (iron transport regulator)